MKNSINDAKILIPARKNSKGAPLKNRHLLEYTINIIPADLIGNVCVSTDDEYIIDYCREKSISCIVRPEELSNDTTSMQDVIKHYVKSNPGVNDSTVIIVMYLTYPKRTWADVLKAHSMFESNDAQSLLCKKDPLSSPFMCFYDVNDMYGKPVALKQYYRRQDHPKVFEICHYVIIMRGEEIKKLSPNLYNDKTVYMDVNLSNTLDIDTQEQLNEFMSANKLKTTEKAFSVFIIGDDMSAKDINIANFSKDAMIVGLGRSWLLHDLNYYITDDVLNVIELRRHQGKIGINMMMPNIALNNRKNLRLLNEIKPLIRNGDLVVYDTGNRNAAEYDDISTVIRIIRNDILKGAECTFYLVGVGIRYETKRNYFWKDTYKPILYESTNDLNKELEHAYESIKKLHNEKYSIISLTPNSIFNDYLPFMNADGIKSYDKKPVVKQIVARDKNNVCFTTTATIRPELLDMTYSSFANKLHGIDFNSTTLYINVDPLPSSNIHRIDEVMDVANHYFGKVVSNFPEKANFPAALKWLWERADKQYVFHLEDDWVLEQDIDINEMIRMIGSNAGINLTAYIGLKDVICLSPGVFRGDWVNKVSKHISTDWCPEKQMRLSTSEQHRIPKDLIIPCLKYKRNAIVVKDIGRDWLKNNNMEKNAKTIGKFTTWDESKKGPAQPTEERQTATKKILVHFPIRERANKFFETLELYYSLADDMSNIQFNIVGDLDDLTMNNENVIKKLRDKENLSYHFLPNRSKIEAINAAIPPTGWDIIVLASDDMIPQKKGWDTTIRNAMTRYYPDTDGVLWFFDGYTRKLNTLSILGKKYYDRFNYIYHPDYKSLWCDNEFMDVANGLGKQKYIHNCIIKHEHYVNNKKGTTNDPLLKKNEGFFNHDKNTYLTRKKQNFK